MFLAQFENSPQSAKMLKGVLVTVGEEYVDRPRARRYELQARFGVLKGLDIEAETTGLAESLAVLKEAIENLEWVSTNDR